MKSDDPNVGIGVATSGWLGVPIYFLLPVLHHVMYVQSSYCEHLLVFVVQIMDRNKNRQCAGKLALDPEGVEIRAVSLYLRANTIWILPVRSNIKYEGS